MPSALEAKPKISRKDKAEAIEVEGSGGNSNERKTWALRLV
jgi:hypothetical protein